MQLVFLSDKLPYNMLQRLELARDDSLKVAIDLRPSYEHDSNSFIATKKKELLRFNRTVGTWDKPKFVQVSDPVIDCFVLKSSSVLVVASTTFNTYSQGLEFLSKVKLEDIIGGLSYIV